MYVLCKLRYIFGYIFYVILCIIIITYNKHASNLCDIPDYNEKISNRLIYDEERKYGKIPTRIYMLYLKSCGLYVVLVFCLSAFGWQAFRIFADVWLRGWTDIEYNNNADDDDVNVSYYAV